MKRGHLERRPCRGRNIAWSRVPDVRGGHVVGVHYRLFVRLSTTLETVAELRSFPIETLASARDPRAHIARTLRGMRAQLRWRRDQLDLAVMGLEDTTPRPAVPA